jgi:DNA-binding NarL/FixJ family response regulator
VSGSVTKVDWEPEAGVTPPKQLTVLIADHEVTMRVGTRRALESKGLRVVAEASSAGGAVEAARAYRPDVCLLAVRLPGSGIVAAELISTALPDAKIVMLGELDQEQLFAALRAGAVGYLLRTTSAARLPHAIRGVVEGEAALPRELTERLIREFRESGPRRRLSLAGSDETVELTARQFQVLQRLRQGERTSEIAGYLGISEVTVRRHISAIERKLNAPDRRTALKRLAP